MFFYCLLRARDASTLRRSDSDKFAGACTQCVHFTSPHSLLRLPTDTNPSPISILPLTEIAAARVIFEEYKDNGSGAGFDALYARYARPLASPHRDHFEILSRTPGSGVPAPLDVGESSDSTSSGDDDDDDSSSSSSSSSDDDEDEDSVSTSSDDDGDDDDGHTDSIDSGDEADDDGSDSVDSGDDDDDDDDDHDDHDDDSGDEAICSSSETVDNDDQATDGSSDTVGNGANGGDGEASGHISNNANGRGGNDSNSPAPSILDLFRDGLRESASQGQRRWREIVGNDNWRSQDPCLCRYFGGNLPPRYYCRRHPPPPPPRVEQIEIFQLMAQIWNNHQN